MRLAQYGIYLQSFMLFRIITTSIKSYGRANPFHCTIISNCILSEPVLWHKNMYITMLRFLLSAKINHKSSNDIDVMQN